MIRVYSICVPGVLTVKCRSVSSILSFGQVEGVESNKYLLVIKHGNGKPTINIMNGGF